MKENWIFTCSVHASAIAGHGCPVKPALSHDGELREVASGEAAFLRTYENPFDETDSVETFMHATAATRTGKIDFHIIALCRIVA
ncbi:MAG: hypothetical protein NC242_12600 [Roseburia sp.]|nr:hypothetical protein [Roseburia sp.]